MFTTKIDYARILMIFFIIVISVLAFIPFYSMVVMGTYHTEDLYLGAKFWPGKAIAFNYARLAELPFMRFYRNSLFVATTSAALSVMCSYLAGYAFAKYRFRLNNALFTFILLTMMIPGQLGLIAFIIEVNRLHWMSTLYPLILPAGASAFGVFWMRQFVAGAIPDEIMEAARMDGCSELRILVQVSLPFMVPAFTTLGLLNFLWSWNNFLVPMLVLDDVNLFTIPLGIKRLASIFDIDIGATILATTVATIPILIFFTIFNRTLINGLTAGAIKG
jgi:cellobiose transport system permease protein